MLRTRHESTERLSSFFGEETLRVTSHPHTDVTNATTHSAEQLHTTCVRMCSETKDFHIIMRKITSLPQTRVKEQLRSFLDCSHTNKDMNTHETLEIPFCHNMMNDPDVQMLMTQASPEPSSRVENMNRFVTVFVCLCLSVRQSTGVTVVTIGVNRLIFRQGDESSEAGPVPPCRAACQGQDVTEEQLVGGWRWK